MKIKASLVLLASLAAIASFAESTVLARLTATSEAQLRILAAPTFEGRMTLRPGNIKARDHIAEIFADYGIKPGHNGSYFHPFSITIGSRPTANTFASLTSGDNSRSLQLGTEFLPVGGSASMKLIQGDVVFLGNLNPSGDLSGKVVMMYRRNFGNEATAPLAERLQQAAQAGARGVILVGSSAEKRPELPLLGRRGEMNGQLGLVGISVTRQVGEQLTGMKFGESPTAPKTLNWKLRTVTQTEPNVGTSYNVIGKIAGTDPKLADQPIIIGAHFDHLGYGEVGSRTGNALLHNGADDNGSGTAGLIALAQHFVDNPLRRPIILQGYSGEEVGLVGSLAWVRDNPELVKQTHLMINLDMIGRLREGALTIFCTQSSDQLRQIVEATQLSGLKLSLPPGVPGNSDHAGFVRANVPSLFYHTGLHDEYHTENDTLDTINYEGIGIVLEHTRLVVEAADKLDNKLAFSNPTTTAPQPAGDATGSSSRRVRTGFMPDMSGTTTDGLRLTGVVGGSPAEAAGVKAGDILIRFDQTTIKSIDDLQTALGIAKAGVAVKIVVRRGTETLELTITPVAAQ